MVHVCISRWSEKRGRQKTVQPDPGRSFPMSLGRSRCSKDWGGRACSGWADTLVLDEPAHVHRWTSLSSSTKFVASHFGIESLPTKASSTDRCLSFPVSAFYAECVSKRISFGGFVYTKSKFLGLSVGVHNIGHGTVHLLDCDEHYVVTFPSGYGR